MNEVGNFIKSVLPRLVSKPAQDALASLDISLTDNDGNLRDIIQVYTEVAQKVQGIADSERIAVVEGLAGKFHISRMQALLDDLGSVDSMYRNMEESSRNSAGSAIEENEQYLKSLEARLNLTRVEVEKLALEIGDAFLTEGMIQSIEIFGDMLGVLTSLTTTFGSLPPIMLVLGTSLAMLSTRFKTLMVSAGIASWGVLRGEITRTTTATATQTAAVRTLSTAWKGLLASTGIGIAFAVIGIALEKIISKMGEARQKSEDLASYNRQLAESYESNKEAIDGLAEEYERLSKANREGLLAEGTEEHQRYLDVQEELARLLPELKTGEDAKGRAILASSGIVSGHIELLRERLDLEQALRREEQISESRDRFATAKKELKETEGSVKNVLDNIDTVVRNVNQGFSSQLNLTEMFSVNPEDIKTVDDLAEKLKLVNINKKEIASTDSDYKNNPQYLYYERMSEALSTYMRSLGDNNKEQENKVKSMQLETNKLVTEFISGNEKMSSANKDFAMELLATGIAGEKSAKKLEAIQNIAENFFLGDGVETDIEAVNKALEDLTNSSGADIDLLKKKFDDAFDTFKNNTLIESNLAEGSEEYNALSDALDKNRESRLKLYDAAVEYSKQNKVSLEEAIQHISQMEDFADVYGNASDAVSGLSDEFKALTSSISYINGVLEDYQENNRLSTSTIMELIDKYPDLISYIGDEAELIKQLEKIRDADVVAAKQQMVAKLSMNEEFYNKNIKALEDYFNEHFKFYDGDLKQFKTLAEAKAAVEQELINGLAKQWGVYYNTVSKVFETSLQASNHSFYIPGLDAEEDAKALENAKAFDAMKSANAELQKFRDTWDSFTLDKIDLELDKIGTSLDKNTKSTKNATKAQKELDDTIKKSIYLADTYAQALRNLEFEQAKLNEIQERNVEGSKEWLDAQRKKIALLEAEKKLNNAMSVDLSNQRASGVVTKTGIVTYDSSSSVYSSGSPQADIWNFFKSKGLNDNAVAGIMGNIQQESGFNSKAVNKSSGASGIFQWLGSRKTELQNYAKSIGKSWEDLSVQLDFAWKEMNASEKKALETLKKSNLTASQHASEFDRLFERSGKSQVAQRQQFANNALKTFSGSSASLPSSSARASMADYYLASNGFRMSSGFGKRNTGIPGASTDHMGLDLAAKAGTDIKAVRGGKVIANAFHDKSGNYVNVLQDDGLVARYLHMEKKSPLEIGSIIQAGDSVGKVGNTGNSRGAHLHLEIRDPNQKGTDPAGRIGKAQDPLEYLKKQTKGITESSKALAEHEQDLDALQAKQHEHSMKNLAINKELRQAYMDLFDGETAGYRQSRDKIDQQLQNSENRLKKMNSTSQEYRDELDLQSEALERKQKYNREEYEYYDRQIKSGKLSAVVVADLRDRMHELGLELNDLNFGIDDNFQRQLGSHSQGFDDRRGRLSRELEYEEAKLEGLEEGSERYFKTLEKINSLTERNIAIEEEELAVWEDAIKSGKLYGDALTEAKAKAEELRNSLMGLNNNLRENQERFAQAKFDINDKKIGEVQDKIDFLSYKLSLLDEEDVELKAKINLEMQGMRGESVKSIEDAISEAMALRSQAIASGNSTKLYDDQIKGYVVQRRSQLSDMQSVYKEMQTTVENAHSKIAEAETKAYEEASKFIDEAIKRSEDAIRRFSDNIAKLQDKLLGLQESDFEAKIGFTSKQLAESKKMANQIIAEYDRVTSTPVYNEEQQKQVEDKLKSLRDELSSVNGEIINYVKSLERNHFERLIYGANQASKEIDRLTSKLNRNLEMIEGGMLSGTSGSLNLSPDSIVGKTLDLDSLVSNPLREREVQVEIQDIRNSSYGKQIIEAEDFHVKMEKELKRFHEVSTKETEKYEQELKLLMEISKGEKENIKKEENRLLLASTENMSKEEQSLLNQHYQDLHSAMKSAMTMYREEYASIWDSIVADISSKVRAIESAASKAKSSSSSVSSSSSSSSKSSDSITTAVPKYKQGTKGHPGGVAMVGDGTGSNAGSELIETPDGKVFLSPDSPTLMNLPKGTKVASAKETGEMTTEIPKYADGIGGNEWNSKSSKTKVFDIERWIAEEWSKVNEYYDAEFKKIDEQLRDANGRVIDKEKYNQYNDELFATRRDEIGKLKTLEKDLILKAKKGEYIDPPKGKSPSPSSTNSSSPTSNNESSSKNIEDAAVELVKKTLVHSEEFIEKWQPYKSIKDGGQIYEQSRQSELTDISDLQSSLKKVMDAGDLEATQKLTQDILDKQRELSLQDQKFIIESLKDLSEQREKNAIEARNALYDYLKNNELTEEAQSYYYDEIAKLDDVIANSYNERKRLIKQEFDYEKSLRDQRLRDIKDMQDQISFNINMLEILKPSDLNSLLSYQQNMYSIAQSYTAELQKQKAELLEQIKLYEVGSFEWNLINEQVKENTNLLRQSYLEQARLQKDMLKKKFDIQLRDTERQLFGGQTESEARDAFEERMREQDKYLDGLEKQLEIEKLTKMIQKDKLQLTGEQLALLNTQGKIEKSSLERLKKQLEIQKLQLRLENLKKEQNIQQLTKREDGTWDFEYVADLDAIDQAEEDLKNAQLDLLKHEQQLESDKEREDLDRRSKYFRELSSMTEKALNGEYENANQFLINLRELNGKYAEFISSDVTSGVNSLTSAFSNFLSTVRSFESQFVLDIEKLDEEKENDNEKSSIGTSTEKEGTDAGKIFAENLIRSFNENFDDSFIKEKFIEIVSSFSGDEEVLATIEELSITFSDTMKNFLNSMLDILQKEGKEKSSSIVKDVIKEIEKLSSEFKRVGSLQGREWTLNLAKEFSMAEFTVKDTLAKLLTQLTLYSKEFELLGSVSGKSFVDGLINEIKRAESRIANVLREMSKSSTESMSSSLSVQSFATGGYTGSSEGLAYLHSKEIILNKDDTRNLLEMVNISRNIPEINELEKPSVTKEIVTEQNLNFGDLVFPNVKNSQEIQDAIKNLPKTALTRVRTN